MITSTISYLELFWVSVIVIGVIASLKRVWSVYGDLQYRNKLGHNGILLKQARNDFRAEVVKLLVMTGLLYIGYRTLILPNAAQVWNIHLIIAASIFMLIPVLLTYDSIQSQRTREYILDELERRNHHEGTTD